LAIRREDNQVTPTPRLRRSEPQTLRFAVSTERLCNSKETFAKPHRIVAIAQIHDVCGVHLAQLPKLGL
jgi:hypothetical protein